MAIIIISIITIAVLINTMIWYNVLGRYRLPTDDEWYGDECEK